MSKNYISSPDAATGKTTAKQEKYEKKMAKYLANKAREEHKQRWQEMATFKQNVNPTSDWRELEKELARKARRFYENHETFIHFPITYNGKLTMLSAVSWSRDAKNYQTTSVTIGGSDERNALDELWDKVLDIELDYYCINLVCSGKKLKPRYIKADTVQEAFEIACKENNVKIVFNAA
jgi:hypothetical protein